MRTILFRGKRADNGEWIEGYYVKDPEERHRIYLKPFESASSNTYYFVIPETIGQFTGLLDKNGKQIFEGDIVRKGERIYKITWNSLHAMWGLFGMSGQTNREILCDTTDENGKICKSWRDSTLTIIGNIYDNPELIK